MKIAVAQMVSGDSLESNLQQAKELIERAATIESADLVVLPENFAMLSAGQYRALAEREHREAIIEGFLRQQAIEYQLWICAGTIPSIVSLDNDPVEGNRVRSACLLYDTLGNRVARYDKIHLFDATVADAHGVYSESETIEPGDIPVWVDTPFGRIGLAICYDLRFPELFRYYAQNDVSLVLIPSAFTEVTGKAHWEVLLRARAVENLMYVVGSNQGGRHGKSRVTWGHSMVVEPWGEVLGTLKTGVGLVSASIDLDKVKSFRSKLPVIAHCKFKVEI